MTHGPESSSLAEVLDRVLDKGVVVDVWARVVVASVDTFLHYAEEMTKVEQAAIGAAPGVSA
jgi:hypothetical protein